MKYRLPSWAARLIGPGYSTCYRCNRPWNICEGHTTSYANGRGCFPLCESCWEDLETPAARWPFYERLLADWEALGCAAEPEEADALALAVTAGQ